MIDLTPDQIATLLAPGDKTAEQIERIAALHNVYKSGQQRCAHHLKDFARASGAGYSIGDAHIYATRPVYRQVPDPQLCAEFLSELESAQLVALIRELLESKPTAHYQTWLRKLDFYDSLQKYLDQHDGYVEAYGTCELAIRSEAPNESYTQLLDPVTLEPLEGDPEAAEPAAFEDEGEDGDPLGSGDGS